MPGVIVVYLGLVTMFVGGVSAIKPLRFLAIHSRWQALAVVSVGLIVVVIGGALPARETRVSNARTHLDDFMPAWQFSEFHTLQVTASKEKVYTALNQVTADEILFFRTLIWIRRFGRPGPESILNPSPETPLLETATRTTFIVLAEEPQQEIVVGTLVAAPPNWHSSGKKTPEGFKALAASRQSGFALAAMNFRLEDCPAPPQGKTGAASPATASSAACTLLTTETRVFATDASTRRRFARYWRVIYPGSSLIRRMWLRAIRKRAAQNP
jgi:hypothetical protein